MAVNVIIICTPDAFANAVKPNQLKQYLEQRGCRVDIHCTASLSRLGKSGLRKLLPGLSLWQLKIYVYEAIRSLALRAGGRLSYCCTGLCLRRLIPLRGALLAKSIKDDYDLLICESGVDAGLLLYSRIAKIQILDLPAPLAEEMYYGGKLSESGFARLRALEINLYSKADYLSFHWHTYTEFVKRYKYDGQNFIDLSYGTEVKSRQAGFCSPPRVVFLGFLEGYWVNLPLLERLTAIYPNIDVFGGPPPPAHVKINYKGYAASKDVLADYQFGLTTITDDPLRRSSFSSKHLEYISYGLPVLTPDWRKDSVLDDSSIYYNEDTFLAMMGRFSGQEAWQEKSKKALATAELLSWPRAFKELDAKVDGLARSPL